MLRNRGNLWKSPSLPASAELSSDSLPVCLLVDWATVRVREPTFSLWDIIFSLTFIGFLSVPSKCGALLTLLATALIGRSWAGVKTLSLPTCVVHCHLKAKVGNLESWEKHLQASGLGDILNANPCGKLALQC